MKAMILAAGRGERLRPWTDRCPKPLVPVSGQPLIAHHLRRLAAAGFQDVVINIAYRGEQLAAALGDGARYGLAISYSRETPGALDTGGGIANALPLLGDAPFVVVSSDVVTDFDYRRLDALAAADDVRLVLTDNPAHHRGGDFGLAADRLVDRGPRYTYAGIGILRPAAFAERIGERFALVQIMRRAVAAGRAGGLHHAGRWCDVGRPVSLARARQPVAGARCVRDASATR